MTKGEDSHLTMAVSHQNDGQSGSFDQGSPSSYISRNSYESSPASSIGSDRDRHRSSSSGGSSSRSRSRSHPRCHRHSHCRGHRRDGHRRSSSRRHSARSRSRSHSPSLDRYRSHRRRPSSRSTYSRPRARFNRFPRSPSRSHRSPSRLSGSAANLSLEDKRELLKAAKTNAMKLLGVGKLELPESVKPILTEQIEEPEWGLPMVRPRPERMSPQQSSEVEAMIISPKMTIKTITFSINNCVAKPTILVPPAAVQVTTPQEEIYESSMPYGHWVPVASSQSSRARKQGRKKSK
ncbi:arginine/serine-rich protein 1 isoform X1 [Stigmatopora argus]